MKVRNGLVAAAMTAAVVALAAPAPSLAGGHGDKLMQEIKAKVPDANAAEVIYKRRKAMRALGGNMKKIAGYVKKGEGSPETVANSAREIASIARAAPDLFPAGTGMDKYEGVTGAKAEIWSMSGEFKTAATNLASLADSLAKAASASGAGTAEIGKAFGPVGKMGCGGCHRTFRQKLK